MTDQQPRRIHRRQSDTTPPANVFRLEGEYWTIAYQGTVLRLRDTKGLRYLAHLLRRPDEAISACDLIVALESAAQTSPARSALDSPSTSEAERARLAVTKRLKSAIRTIQQHDPILGYHLGVSIKTGARCSYRPEPGRAIAWG